MSCPQKVESLWCEELVSAHRLVMTPQRREANQQTLAHAVRAALLGHRRRLGLSLRAYAAVRGRPSAAVAMLESWPGSLRLDDVVEALEGTGFALVLVPASDSDCGCVCDGLSVRAA